MWIRSQDGLSLGEYKEVYIVGASIMGAAVAQEDTKLGDYETQDMAKEVLNRIQDRIVTDLKMNRHIDILILMPTIEEVKNYMSEVKPDEKA